MEGLIRFAAPGDNPALKALWQQAFDDTPEGTLFYFARRHKPENTLLYAQGAEPLAMLTMLPITLDFAGRQLPGRYLFAVATREDARGRGLSTQLLEAAHRHMEGQGVAASVLAPAQASLFAFYEKRGYQTHFYADTITVPAGDIPPYAGQARELTAQDYLALRDSAFSASSLFVRWDEAALQYVLASTRLYGGLGLYAQDGDTRGCALCDPLEDGRVRVTDMALEGMMPLHLLAALHQRLNARAYELRVGEGLWPGARRQPLGMLCPLRPLPDTQGAPPYLALIKD